MAYMCLITFFNLRKKKKKKKKKKIPYIREKERCWAPLPTTHFKDVKEGSVKKKLKEEQEINGKRERVEIWKKRKGIERERSKEIKKRVKNEWK